MANTCKSNHNNYKYIYCPKCGINLEQNKNICNALTDIYKSYLLKHTKIDIMEFINSLNNKIRGNLVENIYIAHIENNILFYSLSDILNKYNIQDSDRLKDTLESNATLKYYINKNNKSNIYYLYQFNDMIERFIFCVKYTSKMQLSIIEEDLYYSINTQLKQLRLKGLTVNQDLINKIIKENS